MLHGQSRACPGVVALVVALVMTLVVLAVFLVGGVVVEVVAAQQRQHPARVAIVGY